jgi:hypothetical protein
MNELMTASQFKWFLTILTGGLAGVWLLYDLWNLSRLRGKDKADPIVADKRFGFLIGILIGVVGCVGVLRFHGVV